MSGIDREILSLIVLNSLSIMGLIRLYKEATKK